MNNSKMLSAQQRMARAVDDIQREFITPALNRIVEMAAMESEEVKRFRSFAERYVIERAQFFRQGSELDDAWACVSEAKTIYKMAHRQGQEFNDSEQGFTQQFPAGQRTVPPPNHGRVGSQISAQQLFGHLATGPTSAPVVPLPDTAGAGSARARYTAWQKLKAWAKSGVKING